MEPYPPKTPQKSPYLEPTPASSTSSTLPRHPNLDPGSLYPTPLILTSLPHSLPLLPSLPPSLLLSLWPCQHNECAPVLKPSMPLGRDGCAHHSRSLQSLREYSAATPDPVSSSPGARPLNAARRGAPCLKQLLKPDSRDGGEPHP